MCRAKRPGGHQNRSQSKFTPIHLCGLVQYESTWSRPALTQRSSGHSAAMPAWAASTCNQIPSRRQMAASSGTGSKAVVDVVPAVAHTKKGRRPAARSSAMAASSASGRMANAASWATTRRLSVPTPATRTPFSIDEWACEVA
jgi:hypothetical protein